MGQWRARFDADITFTNGGGLQVQDFRLDIPDEYINGGDVNGGDTNGGDTNGGDIDDAALGELFVRHLGLLMVGDVRISNRELLREAHKGSRGVEIGQAKPQLVELSHVVRHGMVTYPGLPGPEISDHLSREQSREIYAPGTEFHIGRISMVANTGTYLDTPAHRFDGGADLATFPLDKVADLDGVVIRVTGTAEQGIDRPTLAPYDVRGRAVLLHTGWDQHWGTETYGDESHPYLTDAGASWLVEQGAALVGIDSVNIDDTRGRTRPAHTTLLRAGIPVVEHLRGLEQVPPSGFRFHAAPPQVEGMGTFPVRAYAVIAG